MECQDYLSFSQKLTKNTSPAPTLFVTTLLSEIIPEPANIWSDVFLPPHTTFYQNNLYLL